MPVKPPTSEQLAKIAQQYKLHMSSSDIAFFQEKINAMLSGYRLLDQMSEPLPPVKYPRTSGYRPSSEENLLNAWYRKASIKGAEEGPLVGKRIAIKDNTCVAGLPMMNGSSVLEGYVPEFDATVVTRILDAGGEIAGKAVCEHLCLSGGSHTADSGPVHNPHRYGYSAGGSSSGSAALVVAGECDMAIGCDQGGSIRMPSSWCGAYGLKPTYGLVPYTGIFPLELTVDHVGPIAATTADVALLLEAIAGTDGLDPRQNGVRTEPYTQALTGDVKGLRIGIVKEGFAWPTSESDVDEMVEAAAQHFSSLGAEVSTISIPLHRTGAAILTPIYTEGGLMTVTQGRAMGTNWKGFYATSLVDAFARGMDTRADDFSDMVKLYTLLGQYMRDSYHGRYYAKAQNLVPVLTKAYDDALKNTDVLVMPTMPMKATPLPNSDASRDEIFLRASEMIANTSQFDATGHPAMSVPCGLLQGLPVGMMLIGRHWEDATVLRASHSFEQISGYTVRPEPRKVSTLM